MAKFAASLLTAMTSLLCVPAQLDEPADALTIDASELVPIELEPALPDAELEHIDGVFVLAPLCDQIGAARPLVLARRLGVAGAALELPSNWQELCSRRPLVVTAAVGAREPVQTFPLTRSGHLSERVAPLAPTEQPAMQLTSTDLIGLYEQLEARPDWRVVDAAGLASWLAVEPDYVRPGRRHDMPLVGHSWFLDESEDTDARTGCPLRALVESRWLYHFDGRTVETLAGPPVPTHGVLEHWRALLERRRPPLLLADAHGGTLGWQLVGNQLVDHPRCTTGELAIAARWIEDHRRTLPKRANDLSAADYVAWLYEAHARVGPPPATMPELAWLMRRMYLIHVRLAVRLAAHGSAREHALAAVSAWWRDPANLEQQPRVLCDMEADEVLDGDDPLASALFERVFPLLLLDDAAWWRALAERPDPALEPSRRARGRRDAFILAHAEQLPAASRRAIARLCSAWHAAGRSPGEPQPCTSVASCDE